MTQRLHSPDGRVTVALPPGWQVLTDPTPGSSVAVETEVDGADGHRTNLVLTQADQTGLSFRDWQVSTDEVLPRMLADYLLVDLEKRDVAGLPGGRRLAHHVAPGDVAVTMEQWFTAVADVGYTLTATVDSWRYDDQADLLAEVAASLRVEHAQDTDERGSG